MLQNFRCVGVFFFRDVPGLLEQRQIDVRLDIALRARITVPVPGPAEVSALFDYADVLDASLAQTRARHQTTKAATDDQDSHIVTSAARG